jgi:transcriptional/translational regulatory protein YebC/TACO1
MSGFARKLASNDFSVNIFLMSMCRVIHRSGNNDESYLQQLNEDTQSSEAKYEGYKKSGFSVMIFDCSNGNPAVDGSLIRKFMEKL